MMDLGFLALLAVWSAGVGLGMLRRWGGVPEHPADALALAVPLGLGALALAALALGEVGWLHRAGLVGVLGLGGVIAAVGMAEWWGSKTRPTRQVTGVYTLADLGFDLALAAGVVGTLLTALAPVTDGDALCYHLQVPKVFLASGSVGFEPDLHETVYPLVAELLFAVALAFRGPVACRLVLWLLGLVFAAGVTALARPVLGRRARWAGTVALLVPAVSNGMSAPLNDVALAAFATAALVAWVRWQERPSLGGAALAGVLAGMALGVKYPALVWVGLLGLGLGLRARRTPSPIPHPPSPTFPISKDIGTSRGLGMGDGGWLPSLAAFTLAAVLVGGGWYWRAYRHTGNPVYPFFRQVFGGAGIDEVLDPIKRPMAVTPWNLLTALGPMTLEPDRFDSFAHQFGPAFLLFLPGLLLYWPPRRVVGLVALALAFLMVCLTRRQSMRFVLPAVGPMAVGVAWLADRWCGLGTRPARALLAALGLVLAFEATLAVGRARHGWNVVLGRESAGAYLARREPTVVVGGWIGANLPASARLIGQDHRGFYLPRPYTMELAHRRRTGLGRRGESAGAIAATLRARGFTHLLLCPPVPETAVEFDPTLGRLLAPWLAARRPLYRAELADGDGVVRRYALYDLGDGP